MLGDEVAQVSRCSAAHVGASPVTSTRMIGGLPGCRSTSSRGAAVEEDIVVSLRLLVTSQAKIHRDLPSTRPARSARTGCRVTSLSDTSRFKVTASFTADSDVPPRSKKWSRRPI